MSALPNNPLEAVATGQAPRAVAAVRPPAYSPFIALLLGQLAVLGWLVFQTQQLVTERQNLQVANLSLQQTVDSAARLRSSLDALAADTQRVADAGNPSARVLIEELRKRGITINSPAAPAAAPAATPAPKPAGG